MLARRCRYFQSDKPATNHRQLTGMLQRLPQSLRLARGFEVKDPLHLTDWLITTRQRKLAQTDTGGQHQRIPLKLTAVIQLQLMPLTVDRDHTTVSKPLQTQGARHGLAYLTGDQWQLIVTDLVTEVIFREQRPVYRLGALGGDHRHLPVEAAIAGLLV